MAGNPWRAIGVTRLSEFAKLARYYNLAALSNGKAAQSGEPIDAWWCRDVGQPIIAQHYSDLPSLTELQKRRHTPINPCRSGPFIAAFAIIGDVAIVHPVQLKIEGEGPTLIDTLYRETFRNEPMSWLQLECRAACAIGECAPLDVLDERMSDFSRKAGQAVTMATTSSACRQVPVLLKILLSSVRAVS
jgi:hypothetical protein